MSGFKVDPQEVVPTKLYTAALKYVNAMRKKAGAPVLKKLPEAVPGIEGCPIGQALQPLHAAYTAMDLLNQDTRDSDNDDDYEDDDYYDEDESEARQVRVTSFGSKTVIRLRDRKTLKFRRVVAPLYITKFLTAFEKGAET
jgi:hypothetical protein